MMSFLERLQEELEAVDNAIDMWTELMRDESDHVTRSMQNDMIGKLNAKKDVVEDLMDWCEREFFNEDEDEKTRQENIELENE